MATFSLKSIRKGSWNNSYQSGFSYNIDGKSFLFADQGGSDADQYKWFISILENLSSWNGSNFTSGNWEHGYDSTFAFKLDGQDYMFAQSLDSKDWFISQLTDDPSWNGYSITHGTWNNFYPTIFPFYLNGNTYIFGHTLYYPGSKRWFISQLTDLPSWRGAEIASGELAYFYGTAFAFNIENNAYMFAQTGDSGSDNKWFISQLSGDASWDGSSLATGHWNNFYTMAFPFDYNGTTYMFAGVQNGRWFISELSNVSPSWNGEEISSGTWSTGYFEKPCIPFVLNGNNYILLLAKDWEIFQIIND